jgi:hypothetical protein
MKMIQKSINEFESNISPYDRKIQNRLSARKVRGRKETAFDKLEQED